MNNHNRNRSAVLRAALALVAFTTPTLAQGPPAHAAAPAQAATSKHSEQVAYNSDSRRHYDYAHVVAVD